jgi:hypothetical protein
MSVPATKICESCGMAFPKPRLSNAAWSKTKYCSRACFGVGHSTHGHTRNHTVTPTYRAWVNMRTRCENPKSSHYADYGGRGISVCERWKSYEHFLADVGEKPSKTAELDRHPNNDGNYEPGNVRWSSRSDQCRNRRSNRAVIRSDGARFNSLAEAAEAVSGTIGGIWDACNGKARQHRDFAWSYA